MAVIKTEISEAQADVLETEWDGRVMLVFVQTGCDGLLRVIDYEKDEPLIEALVVLEGRDPRMVADFLTDMESLAPALRHVAARLDAWGEPEADDDVEFFDALRTLRMALTDVIEKARH